MAKHESIRYRGIKFYRYPNSPSQAHQRYWSPGIGDRQKGVDYLHREIWRDAHDRQPIPEGYHVHHINHDFNDNRPENLELIHRNDHFRHHAEHNRNDPEWMAKMRKNADKARAFAPAWHASEEGREWHSKHGFEVWEDRLAEDHACQQCGEIYSTRSFGRHRFCSNKCKSAWRRDAGLDDVERACAYCGTVFIVNKYVKKRCCARACTTALGREERAEAARKRELGDAA